MKPLLVVSLALNLALAGTVGYFLGARASAPIAKIAPEAPGFSFAQPPAPAAASIAVDPTPAEAQASPSTLPIAQTTSATSFGNTSPAPLLAPAAQPRLPRPAAFSSQLSTASPAATGSQPPLSDLTQGSAPEAATANGQPVNPRARGNSLNFRGVRVAVAETYPGNDAGAALGLDVTPSASASDNTSSKTDGSASNANNSSTGGAIAGADSPRSASPVKGGSASTPATPAVIQEQSSELSQEDELFRMKWGWAAFDAARAEARNEAQRKQLAQ